MSSSFRWQRPSATIVETRLSAERVQSEWMGAESLEEEIESFMISRRALRCSPATIRWYERCLAKLTAFLERQGIWATHQITAAHIRAFLLHLEVEGHSPGGAVTLFTGVRAYLNWYREEHQLHSWKPLANVRAPRRPQDPLRPVSVSDVQAMVAACPAGTFTGDRDRALLYFLLDSGVRHAELTRLRIGDLDLESGRVKIHLGKGRKSRVVYIGGRTRRELGVYLAHRPDPDPAEPLWTSARGFALKKSGIRELIRRRARSAGVTPPGLHAFRRAFAVNALRNGMDVFTLQRLMGHAELSTVQRYLALVEDDLRHAQHRFGVVDGLSKVK